MRKPIEFEVAKGTKELLLRIAELEAQIEKMKRCDMCKYSTRLGYCKIRQYGGVCENRDKWEIKEE